MIVYQTDRDGWYVGTITADESPLEPGVYLIPAGAYADPPPDQPWPPGTTPRRTGDRWSMQYNGRPTGATPVQKLAEFLAANPDVAALINNKQGASPGGV
jgi:hypothetical protein